ncbi:MAG TPA: hypothetical protein VHO69_01590 [Phototrophicaceae bacterium]|nr:hypothetical protein [Phototrophicaceae bacterium]
MTDSSQTNYPDVLGHITGGERLNVSAVQMALAVRPRVTRAGRPFEAILLIQNASDVDVDVTATLQIPEFDAKKQKKRFIAKNERLVVGLRPAEVGYVVLPLASLPDTAVSDAYKVGMAVEVKPLGKPRRVRLQEGGGAVVIEYIGDEAQAKIAELKKLAFSTTKRGLVGTVLEAGFSVMSGQIGQLADLKPGWISLWKMSDYYRDESLLLDRYGDLFATKVLPQLKRIKLFNPLMQATLHRFQAAGYKLKPIEAQFITKLLVGILEMSSPKEDAFDYLSDDFYNVTRILTNRSRAEDGTITMPSWCRGMLRAIDNSELAAEKPAQALATTLYDELLRDAMRHAFKMLKTTTGTELGNDADIEAYIERFLDELHQSKPKLAFTDAYLPLILGGVIFYDRVIMPEEKIGESLMAMAQAIDERASERDEDNELVMKLAEQVVDQALQKYGYKQ